MTAPLIYACSRSASKIDLAAIRLRPASQQAQWHHRACSAGAICSCRCWSARRRQWNRPTPAPRDGRHVDANACRRGPRASARGLRHAPRSDAVMDAKSRRGRRPAPCAARSAEEALGAFGSQCAAEPAAPSAISQPDVRDPEPALIIATWNVNSVRQRLPHLLDYLREVAPDAICLQEIKCQDDAFPREEIEALGYNVATHGQKTFNGVAILVEASVRGRARPARRRERRAVALSRGGDPAGRSAWCGWRASICRTAIRSGTEKYAYKLAFMDRLIRHARKLLAYEEPLVIAGDYNVIPEPRDAAHPEQWTGDALFLPQTRAKFQRADGARLHRRAARDDRRGRASTRSGTIRPARGSGTTASASTICCCRRRRPTGCAASTSTRRCAARRRRRTMCR